MHNHIIKGRGLQSTCHSSDSLRCHAHYDVNGINFNTSK